MNEKENGHEQELPPIQQYTFADPRRKEDARTILRTLIEDRIDRLAVLERLANLIESVEDDLPLKNLLRDIINSYYRKE